MNRISRQATTDFPEGLDRGLWFIPLGGAGEIGMNLNLYGCDGAWLMVDLGVTFGDDTHPGIDVVMPDPTFIAERREKLAGLIVTHAHEDHVGAVAHLWPRLKCPVYTTPFAAEFLKLKLKETGLEDEVPVTVVPLGGQVSIGPFDVTFVSLTHSIPEPNALVIRTRHGTLFHTGDWKFDAEPVVGVGTDFAALEALGKEDVLALVGDSTNVFSDGESGSESTVRDNLTKLVGRCTGRVAVACFASNVARLDSIARAAMANNRSVALVGASLWRIVDTARRTGYLAPEFRFHEAKDAAHLPRENVLYICTGSQGEGRAALMRIAFDQHQDVALGQGDTVIFSSRVIPGNEQAVHKVQNQLVRMGVELVTWRDEMIHVSGHPARDELRKMYGLVRPRIAVPVHGELMHMKAHAKLAEECQVPMSVVAENGQAVRFSADGAEVAGTVWSGRLALLDNQVVSFADPVMKERKRVFHDGAVSVALVMDAAGNLLDDPLVAIFGVSDPLAADAQPQRGAGRGGARRGAGHGGGYGGGRDWREVIENAVNRLPKKARCDDVIVEDTVRAAVRKAFAPLDKKPVVKVQISSVD